MPRKGGKVTAQERAFIKHMAATNDKTYAATKAGYRQPETVGHIVAAKPAIKAEIAREQTEKLFSELLPLAVTVHAKILADDKTPAGARVQAIKLAYDRTLGQSDAAAGKEPHEMTPEEIAKALAQLQTSADALKRAASDKARPVLELEPIDEAIDEATDEAEKGIFD